MTKAEFIEMLQEMVLDSDHGLHKIQQIRTFKEAMMMTNEDGLVFNMNDGSRFIVTIQES